MRAIVSNCCSKKIIGITRGFNTFNLIIEPCFLVVAMETFPRLLTKERQTHLLSFDVLLQVF